MEPADTAMCRKVKEPSESKMAEGSMSSLFKCRSDDNGSMTDVVCLDCIHATHLY